MLDADYIQMHPLEIYQHVVYVDSLYAYKSLSVFSVRTMAKCDD